MFIANYQCSRVEGGWVMSFKFYNDVIKRDSGLSCLEHNILLHLAYCSADDKTISMSITTLAMKAHCTEQTALRNVQKLVKAGYLIPIGTAGGRGNIQAYRIEIDYLPYIEKKKPLRRTRKIVDESEPPPPAPANERTHEPAPRLKPRRLSDEEIASLAASMRR